MCKPSATSAIEPNSRPPMISATIMTAQSAITAQVRRSFLSWPSPRKTWLWLAVDMTLVLAASLQVGLHGLDQLFGTARPLGVFHRVDDVEADMVFDHFGHQAVHGAARRDDQMQHRGAALLAFERALDRFDLAAHAADAVEQLVLLGFGMRHRLTPRIR